MPTLSVRAVTQRQPSRVKELAKFFTPTSDEEENSRVNNRTRRKKLFEPKKEESEK